MITINNDNTQYKQYTIKNNKNDLCLAHNEQLTSKTMHDENYRDNAQCKQHYGNNVNNAFFGLQKQCTMTTMNDER